MQQQIYTIDIERLDDIRKRSFIKGMKIMIIVALFCLTMLFIQLGGEQKGLLLISGLASLPIYLFAVWQGTGKLKNSYKTYELILNDLGVHVKGENIPYVSISWSDLKVKEQPNGIIELKDNNISSFMRFMYGKGRILVQPEIINREKLLVELNKKSYAL